MLARIGRKVQAPLSDQNASLYKIKVTSGTRTVDDIQKLRKKNSNSSENSAHRYGTTFDVSWVRYTKIDESDTLNIDSDRLKMVLAMELREQKKEKRCYNKQEGKAGWYQITVRV